jgi:hypothetical protein
MKVPDVCGAPAVNAASFPAGSAEVSAVSDVMASASGSEAATVNEMGEPSGPPAVAGATTEGARSLFVTVTAVPPSANVGVQVKVPDVSPAFVVNAPLFPAGSAERSAVRDEIALPSGSDAVTRTVRVAPSAVVAEAGAMTAGARSMFVTVTAVEAEPESAFEAVNVTV